MNLVERLSREIARVTEVKSTYEACRGMPGVIVEPAIKMIGADLERAQKAMGGGDIVEMATALKALQEITE